MLLNVLNTDYMRTCKCVIRLFNYMPVKYMHAKNVKYIHM